MESVMAINVLLLPNNPKTMANIAINNSEPIKQIIDKISLSRVIFLINLFLFFLHKQKKIRLLIGT